MESATWEIEVYRDSRGREPVTDFIKGLQRGAGRRAQAKISRAIDLLEQDGLVLPTTYLHKVRGGVWELLATFQRNAYRVLFYNPSGRTLVLLHAFLKDTNAITEADIQTAERRMQDDRHRRGETS